MRGMAATVGVAHTFEVVTQTERVAVIGPWHWRACRMRHLLGRLLKSEPWYDLELGEWCWILYLHL